MKAKDLLNLPISERRSEMEKQCTPQIIHHYEVTCPECGLYYGGTGGHAICICQRNYGYNCTVCGEPIVEPQPTEHTESGLAHAYCLSVKHDAKKFEFSHWQFEWKVEDLWIGAFWKRTGSTVDLWLCFIPCVPLHISWGWKHSSQ